MVYEFDVSDATACGRFMVPGPAFPRNAFRELTFSLRGDQTLYIRIISYDLWTLYLEGNVYKYGRWHHITLWIRRPPQRGRLHLKTAIMANICSNRIYDELSAEQF